MTTHKSIEQARAAAKGTSTRCIIEIEHATEGRCYINCAVPMANLKIVLRSKPMTEIKALIADHPFLTESETAAIREKLLRENTECERCGTKIDGNTAYSQQEWFRGMRVTAHYCESCRQLLANIGAGEHADLQERAAERGSYEPYTKED